MSSLFSSNNRREYRDTLSRLFEVLYFMRKREAITKWRISCLLETSVNSVDTIINMAERHKLVTEQNRKYKLTLKGERLLEVLLQ